MYLGRFIIIGETTAVYRVSSRSYPNRQIISRDNMLTVVPTSEAAQTNNPYVSYNCMRQGGEKIVIGNGSHVDPIAEKIDRGYPARDALAEALLALDYEKDDYNTPRIAGIVGSSSYVGIIRQDAVIIRSISEPTLVSTYENDAPTTAQLSLKGDIEEIAQKAYELEYEHPVCAAAVTHQGQGEGEGESGDIVAQIYNGK
ncbi:IMP cyclohydrolase [Haloquadratum walsbyi]|uniref:IMP cyclohydrolase n=1 Tax=Haloquadratum walsbyi (strain DSM 16854 / JCM 12705 / C23) TaxID=768065 RepID=G0LFX0_HALWC|nr:IMP cyclohydrolase [Haloquadratum walsbyi]CCC38990.1 inosine-5'-monophosphate cyclohydrolase,archaeal-type [Haloquadratum walsbyi C23]